MTDQDRIAALEAEVARLKAERDEQEELIDALGQVVCGVAFTCGQYDEHNARVASEAICAFCGVPGPRTPEAMQAHMATCERHPFLAERAGNALLSAQVTTLTEQRDLCAAEAMRMREQLGHAQHLLDDVDQGPRGENSKEWRIPWSRSAVEVFTNIATTLASPSTAAQVLSERDERVRAEVAGAIPLAVAAALESERNGEFAERQALEVKLAASQAHVAELRAAATALDAVLEAATTPGKRGHWIDKVEDVRSAVRAALARESSTDALREFGRKVADECFRQASITSLVDGLAAVDAVLWGER